MTPDLIERLRSVVGWWHKPTGNVFSAADYRDLKPKWQSRFPLADMDADFVPLVSALIPVEPVPTPREAELEAALREFVAAQDVYAGAQGNAAIGLAVGLRIKAEERARLALNHTHGKEPKDVA